MIHEVMNHVILLHKLSEPGVRRKMMNRVVRVIVAKIADQKSREKRLNVDGAQKQTKKTKEHDRDQNARNGRHHQAGRIVRIIVMKAVNDEDKSFREIALSRKVKDVVMKKIFSQGP